MEGRRTNRGTCAFLAKQNIIQIYALEMFAVVDVHLHKISSRTQNHSWAKFSKFSCISNRFYIVCNDNRRWHRRVTSKKKIYTYAWNKKKTVNLKNAHEWKSMCPLSTDRIIHTVTKANWLFIHIKLSIPFCYHLVPNLTIYVWSLIEKWSKFMVLCYLTTEYRGCSD